MNSTIGIDNLFIQPLVNVILYTVKKIELLVKQKKSSFLLVVIALAVRGVAHGFRQLNLLICILTNVLVLHSSECLASFSVERPPGISSSVKITRQDPKFSVLSTLLLSLSTIAIQSIPRIWLQLPELFARVTSSCKWAIGVNDVIFSKILAGLKL